MLTPHPEPLTEADARHLLRRAAFGASPDAVSELVGMDAEAAADLLLSGAASAPLPEDPDWLLLRLPSRPTTEQRQEFNRNNREWVAEVRADWIQRMRSYPVLERFAMMWHDHFVTGISSYRYAAVGFRYLNVLRSHALGNLQGFVHAIGTEAAMLAYLNGNTNTAEAPNENYARELLELFTMGPTDLDGNPNYTESDLREIARALTGWTIPRTFEPAFVNRRHDGGEKTFFGRTGSFGYDDVIRILFEARGPGIAHFVASKLYADLIAPEPDPDAVAQLAEQLLSDSFELRPTVQTVLSSALFFSEEVRGARIKSPVDHLMELVELLGVRPSPGDLRRWVRYSDLGNQALLEPPNVAGWPGNRAWIDTTTLPLRWAIGSEVITGRRGVVDVTDLARGVADDTEEHAVFRLATRLPEWLFALPLSALDIPELDDPFGGDLDTFPIPDWVTDGPRVYGNLTKALLGGAPWYEWSLESPSARRALEGFLQFLTELPAYQLS